MSDSNTVHSGAGFARPESMVWREPDRYRAPWLTCGYCGGMKPEELLRLRDEGRILSCEMADQKYGWPHKFYVDIKNPEPELQTVVSHISWDPNERKPSIACDWVASEDLTPDQLEACRHGYLREGEEPTGWWAFTGRESLHGKFYTVHLIEPDLDQETREKVGYILGLIFEPGDKPGSIQWRPYPYERGGGVASKPSSGAAR